MIDQEFLKFIRGKDDMKLVVEEPEKIQEVKRRIAVVNEDVLKNMRRVKTLDRQDVERLFAIDKQEEIKRGMKKNLTFKNIKSLPSVKSAEPCPEGFIRSTRSGKCIKDKKFKAKRAKKVNVEDSILRILRDIKS